MTNLDVGSERVLVLGIVVHRGILAFVDGLREHLLVGFYRVVLVVGVVGGDAHREQFFDRLFAVEEVPLLDETIDLAIETIGQRDFEFGHTGGSGTHPP
ncbi:MAG: hypothetical protein ACI9YT_000840 [Halobacteriales archaeon]